ncbi:MAG: phage terminase large subunit family protein [Planctomycetales bacterium]|nr:phage terminase large subunit family protein [Planctomycetales bacterium]
MGDRGCLSIFADCAEQHRMFAEQVTAEYFGKTEGRGRTVDEWKPRPEQPDNHWLDCLVGSALAASMQGALLFGTDLQATPNAIASASEKCSERRSVRRPLIGPSRFSPDYVVFLGGTWVG